MAAERVDGNDVWAVYQSARRAVARCREGRGPVFLECLTYRWLEHVGPLDDGDRGYRTRGEIDAWKRRDPIKRSARALKASGLLDAATLARFEAESDAELAKAVAQGRQAPWPDPQDLFRNA